MEKQEFIIGLIAGLVLFIFVAALDWGINAVSNSVLPGTFLNIFFCAALGILLGIGAACVVNIRLRYFVRITLFATIIIFIIGYIIGVYDYPISQNIAIIGAVLSFGLAFLLRNHPRRFKRRPKIKKNVSPPRG